MSDEIIDAELLTGEELVPVKTPAVHSSFDPLLASFKVTIKLPNGMTIEAEGLPLAASMHYDPNGRPHIEIELYAKEGTLTQQPLRTQLRGIQEWKL